MFANRAFIDFCSMKEADVLKDTACGVFGCINAKTTPKGCGFSSECGKCRIFLAIEDTFKTGRVHRNEPYQATLERGGRKQDVSMLGSTALINSSDSPKVLLCLEDITAIARTQKDLEQSRSALSALLARLERNKEEVRANIAREIHDVLGQNLTGIKMDLRWLERSLTKPGMRREAILRRVGEAIDTLDKTTGAVQQLAYELRPSELERLGIAVALQNETRRFQSRTGIHCVLRVPRLPLSLETYAATALFRIFQECTTNVARHARATRIDASLTASGDASVLRVADNGRGISAAALSNPNSLGLLGMRERAVSLGGSLTISRRQKGGTLVTARIPCGEHAP
jgi:signal transduction histidine kinase